MASRSAEHSKYLSYLLDDVTGTEEMVKLKREYCSLRDCMKSQNPVNRNVYYTGSRGEGLDLPGSDEDIMLDMNSIYDIDISESIQDLVQSRRNNKFLIVNDNVLPAFVRLKYIRVCDQQLLDSVVNVGDNAYLSSHLFISSSHWLESEIDKCKVTGPSVEVWTEYDDEFTGSGVDNVQSIHCNSWPTSAAEWKDRPRHYGWPSQRDKEKIEAFGCHLVAVGHPLSSSKSLEWRLSFSIAERRLVWSFNHAQLQCYAVMKLILKECVKSKCTEKHKTVLCSYFIKTFLFWQFEKTNATFWQTSNLICCLEYLFKDFFNCVQTGVLRHYFIPRFNLFEIKLNQHAQIELLHLYRKVMEFGISILGQCKSLSGVFLKFRQVSERGQSEMCKEKNISNRILDNDETLMFILTLHVLETLFSSAKNASYEDLLFAVEKCTHEGHYSTCMATFVIRRLCLMLSISGLGYQGNKSMYYYMNMLDKNVHGTDIASSRLWLATFLLHQGDHCRSLQIINDIFSSIPPYALYYSVDIRTNDRRKQLYVHTFCTRHTHTIGRAQEAWLIDMYFTNEVYFLVPSAIQIELDHCDPNIGFFISPFTYAYFLMFLCHHGLRRYDNRDRALRQLVYTLYDDEKCCVPPFHSYNIVGHCMLKAGNVEMARTIFLESAQLTHSRQIPTFDKYNSAYKYLSLL